MIHIVMKGSARYMKHNGIRVTEKLRMSGVSYTTSVGLIRVKTNPSL